MDDPGLSSMYVKVISKEIASLRRRSARWLRSHSGFLRGLLVVLLLFGLAFGYYAHIRGRFSRLKTELNTMRDTPQHAGPLLVGGQEPIIVERSPLSDGSMPEFLSATLLPGRGMGILQLTAAIPGHGTVQLLDAPTMEDASRAIPNTEADPSGITTARISSPVELPWAGSLPAPQGEAHNIVQWRGHAIDLPLTGPGASSGGLLLRLPADVIEHNVMPDGGSVAAEFDAHDFGARWPSQTHVTVQVLLSNRAFDVRVVARNTGHEPEPFGIGWIPRLVLPSGSRASAMLHLPADQQEAMADGHATGRLLDVANTPLDFTSRAGRRLGTAPINSTFVHLKTGFLDDGPIVELKDVDSGIGLRMSALSQQIRAVRVETGDSPAAIRVGFQTNYGDPFSHVWSGRDDGGLLLLEPGQTVQWRVRFELFTLAPANAPPL